MSNPTEQFMREVHQVIAESAGWAIGFIGPAGDIEAPSTLGKPDKVLLRRIVLSQAELRALEALMAEVGRSIAFSIFSTIDGVADRDGLELPDLALIDRDTGKHLAEGFLHDKFYELSQD